MSGVTNSEAVSAPALLKLNRATPKLRTACESLPVPFVCQAGSAELYVFAMAGGLSVRRGSEDSEGCL
jgi:hypothetical protein